MIIAKKTISIILCICMLVLTFGCSADKRNIISVAENYEITYPSATDMSAHYCVTENLKFIDESGLIKMLFDENSTAVGVKITEEEHSKFWSALPEAVNGQTTSDEAEIIGIEIIHNGSVYYLNSQDNSVSSSNVYWGKTENGYRVVYYLTDEPTCISGVELGSTDEIYSNKAAENILIKATVTYTLLDGCFYADLEWKNLGNQNDVVTKINFLEYFGAGNTVTPGDFIFVPDGCGALIDLASTDIVEPVSVSVYGNDIGYSQVLTGIVPAYGMKTDKDAFVAIIENGDAIANITANKAPTESIYNRVGPEFIITPSYVKEGIRYFSDTSYTGNITLCYRFLNDSDANYSTLAAACRELFIRNHTLSGRSVSLENDMPLYVNVIGNGSSGLFGKKLTEYDQAQDILNRIKSKGVNNVYLRFSGALSGGLDANNAYSAKILNSLGGKKALKELDEYASGLNFNIFIDVSLLTDNKASFNSVKNIVGKNAVITQQNILSKSGFVTDFPERSFVRITKLSDTVLSVLETLNGYNSTGFCVADAGSILYSDFSSKINRQQASQIISDEMQPLSTQNMIMVDKGNFYALKNTDVISNIPMSCNRTETSSYYAVPFVQIILHGIVEFCTQPLNLTEDSKAYFLKCIEYGAIPGFALTNNSFDDSEEYNNKFGVDNWLNYMYLCYEQSSLVLNDLRNSRITDHYKISEGVYCTEYEATTKIYVNYTESPVVISGITVEPMSFFRVN